MKNKLAWLFLTLNVYLLNGQTIDILTDLNPASFTLNFNDYNRETAIYCAQLSEVVYWDSLKIDGLHKDVCEKYPSLTHKYDFIDYSHKNNHTQALLWGNSNFLVISFRGTEPTKLQDWYSDAKFWNFQSSPTNQTDYVDMPPGHGGFRTSLNNLVKHKALFEKIQKILSKLTPDANQKSFPIFFTGHSLGAGIAQFFIEPLSLQGFNFAGAYHFAPPLAVTCAYHDHMKSNYGHKIYDIVNYKDYVPRAGRNSTAHFGKFYRICKDGFMYSEQEYFIKFRFWERFKLVRMHALSSYLDAVKNPENTHIEILNRSSDSNQCLVPKKDIKPCDK